ncbi:hypothetical protein SO802_022950 [Lithocarpus litseifolius]|uniref:Uncharacterized protein n=1 Tax=Lithocarpus litseifolius TaxID=425828 RepID=A0AAW2C6Q1_9ROSI
MEAADATRRTLEERTRSLELANRQYDPHFFSSQEGNTEGDPHAVTGPPTRGRVLGMGASVKPRDVYGPSSSSQCSKQYQGDRLKENEDFELHLKEIEDKSSAEKMEFEGTINRLKEEMPRIIANVLKKIGLHSMQESITQENYKVLVSKDSVFFDVDNTIVIHCGDCC